MLFRTNTIIGHRGCGDVLQNNTVEAFLRAGELGAEMVEMDVRRTADGALLVWHDAAVGNLRIRGSGYEELLVAANELGKVLPTLEEVLRQLEGKIQLNVELKEAGYEGEVVGMILKYFSPSEFVITSFLDQAILAVKKGFPTVKAGLGIGIRGNNREYSKRGLARIGQKWSEIFPWRRMRRCRADFLAVSWRLLFFGVAGRAWKRGVPMMVWVIDTPKMAAQLMRSRMFSGIISNKPGMIAEILKKL